MSDAAVAGAALPAWDAKGFVDACERGDLAAVRELTSPEHMAAHSGVDLNWMGVIFPDATGLWWACYCGHIKVVRYLTSPAMLAAGIDLNKGDREGYSPLALAVCYGYGRVEVVRHLLESPDLAAAGVTVDVNAANCFGLTALHLACRDRVPAELSLLLRQPQLDIEARTPDGKTALQLAEASTWPGCCWRKGHGAKKAALIRARMRLPMARLYVLLVAMWSRREGRRVAAPTGAVASAWWCMCRRGCRRGPVPAVPAGTLDEEDEEARGRRRVMRDLPPFMLEAVCRLASR